MSRRRVVTGHDESGKSVAQFSEELLAKLPTPLDLMV